MCAQTRSLRAVRKLRVGVDHHAGMKRSATAMLNVGMQGWSDTSEVDSLMSVFYQVISFEDGDAPDWERMAALFSAHARITRITPQGIDYLDLSSFRLMAEELIEVGAFTSFFECEVARRLDRFGDVLHIASAYETRVSPTAL